MGVVFLARDVKLDRAVAIKTLPVHLAGDEVVRGRFLREARTAAALSHHNIVPIHRADEIDGVVFCVMGYVDGNSVASRIQQEPLHPRHAVAILTDVAHALDYAHERGVIHRDIKAENILLNSVGDYAMVTDFGIARLAESKQMTATGQVLGTVHYMSPEQITGDALDGRSDLYSLGVVGFRMLSGRFPFEHETPSAVLVAHVTKVAPRLSQVAPQIHPALAQIIDQLLSKDPDLRPARAADVARSLGQLANSALDLRDVPAQAKLSSADAREVWERAAVLQDATGHVAPLSLPSRHTPVDPSLTAGMNLDLVRAAAADAGIAPRFVDQALAERSTPGVPQLNVVVEGPMISERGKWAKVRDRLEFEMTIEGELNQSAMEEAGEEIRRAVGEFGTLTALGRTLTFNADQSPNSAVPRRLRVTVTSRNGKTIVRAYEDLRQMSQGILWGVTGGAGTGIGMASFGGIMAAGKGAAWAIPAIAIAGPVAIGVFGAAALGARAILRYVASTKERELRQMVERVGSRVREIVSDPRLSDPGTRRRLPR